MVYRGSMEATKLKKMMKSIETALSAASFAEADEGVTAQSMLQEGRRVLLALKEGHIDVKTLKYALNTARRIGAHLDILYVLTTGGKLRRIDPVLEQFESELKAGNIPHRLISRTGCLKQQIIDYTNSEKEILFAVIESPHSLDTDCNKRDKTLAELWQQLKCPLVVVMDGARA
jgi:hypothetical protein